MTDSGNLLRDARDGDERALESLLLQHLPSLEAYIRLKAGGVVATKEGAEDIVQSVCIEVLRDAEGFEYRGEPQFRAWLFQQALHKIINKDRYYRRQRRDVARERSVASGGEDGSGAGLSQLYATIHTPSRVLQGREAEQQFEAAFAKLPEDQREAIILYRVAGLPYADIATQLGRSEGSVRNLVYRGLARLSGLLDE